MQKTALWVIGCAVAAAGFVGWYFGSARSEANVANKTTVELEAELRKLNSEVKLLRKQATQPVVLMQPPDDEASPEPTRALAQANAQPRQEPEAQMDADHGRRAPPTAEEVQAQAAEDFERYDEFFASEARDPIWAGETERSITAALAAPELSFAQVERFQCASSVCRLHAHVDAESDLNKLARKFSEAAISLPQGSFRRVVDPAGGLRVEGYFVKPGARLPGRPSED